MTMSNGFVKSVSMCIATIPNRNSPPAILLREGYREDGNVRTRTLVNLSKLPGDAIAVLRQVLQGKQMVPVDELFEMDAEAALDGLYVVRSSVSGEAMSPEQTVRSYKLLSNVERAFRCLKSVDLMVRPIRHRLENRVRAHIFLCMLAYYVEWHMIEAWRPLLFADEDQESKASRDPVAPAERSPAALKKVQTKELDDHSVVHSFRTLLDDLAQIVTNTCRCPALGPDAPTFTKTTTPNAKQQRALNLLHSIRV
jgi:hypothetical protein